MLKTPTWTLKKALHTVLDNAQDYLADVSFHYGETTLWAHRAILLARIPESFLKKHLSPILGEKSSCAVTVLDIERLVPLSLIQPLLRFWYTSEFLPSHTEPPPSLDSAISTSSSSDDDHIQSIRTQLRQLEDRLKVQLLPCNNTDSTDFDRLVSDLERMRNAQLATDVIISIFSPLNISKHKPSQQKTSATDNGGAGLAAGIPSIVFSHADDHDSSDAAAPPSFPAHRFILASQSPYFYAMFCGDFREASTSTIHLPADLFNTISTQVIINYFYTGKVSVPSYSPEANPSPNAQQRLTQKKYSLRVLQQVFAAADYLGHFDTICLAALNEMEACCHQLKCHCSDCAVLLPSMLWFADKNADVVPEMREKLISLYAEDPIHNIAPLWSQKPFAVLVGSLWTPSSSTEALVPLENEEKTLVSEIASLVLENITKYNAIHVLHSLHLCLSQIRSANPMPTWSTPLLDLLNPIIHHTVDMVSQNFDFYCTEYPILLSCIDGIGHGFSVDFLEFLLNRVLSGGIQDDNAGILYQGIVRDLVGRQQVVKNVAVDGVLVEARQKCVRYLSRRWPQVKAQNGFKKIDKETMRHLADDLGVPYRTLAKPFESDFSAIFSFRPKASKKSRGSEDSGGGVRKSHSEASPPRRLSLSALRSQISSNGSRYAEERNSSESDIATTKVTRSRSLSNDFTAHSMISDNLSAENIDKLSAAGLSSQSLIHMLSLESESRRQRLEAEANYNPQPLTTLADALLPLDLSSEVDEHPRPSRLKFALPTAPLRAKSPVQKPFLAPTNTASGNEQGRRRSNRRGRSSRRSRWGIGSSSDLSDDEELVTMVTPVVGSKVELLRRPLPTLGTIKYIGPVNFARGTWVGVELESRLGKNDGAVDGTRYFQTDHQRGVFVKVDDFKIISLPNQSTKDSRTITPTHASALEA